MGIYAKVNGEWKSVDGADAGLEGLGGWAQITSVTGMPNRYTYKDGIDWVAFEWTDTSKTHTLTTQAGGLADVLVISGGNTGGTHPQGGRIRDGIENIGTSNEIVVDTPGGSSAGGRLGDIKVPAIGSAINSGNVIGAGGFGTASSEKVNGVLSSITGTAIEYGTALRQSAGVPITNGNLGPAGPGSSERDGAVIIRVPASLADGVDPDTYNDITTFDLAKQAAKSAVKETVKDKRKKR